MNSLKAQRRKVMKINLTKLLEKTIQKVDRDINIEQTSASYYMKTNYDATSSEEAYSFELEKETFRLEK
jgi:hypothetical protein